MDTKITKGNAKAAIKDDKAHIDYLKRDVLDDQKSGGKYKDMMVLSYLNTGVTTNKKISQGMAKVQQLQIADGD